MYTSASATGSTSSVSMVPGPVLSKSVRKELFPVSTSPAAGLPVPVVCLRSDGKELVMRLGVSSTSRLRRRRMKRMAPMPRTSAPMPPSTSGLSVISYTKLGGGATGCFGAFFGAAWFSATLGGGGVVLPASVVVVVVVVVLLSPGLAASEGFDDSATTAGFAGSGGVTGAGFGGSAGFTSALGASAGLVDGGR